MQITKTKYLTYFFRQNYNLNQEKNTFSAFVPEGKKGFWILTEDSEKKENISKIAVTSVTEAYFSNDIVSEDNMINFLNIANKKIIESKIRKNMDYKNRFSTSIVIAEDDKIIVGNIGSSKIKVFRNNELIEEVEGDTVVGLNLKKYDYILLGTSEFWSILNENKILEMFKKNSSHLGFESELSEKVKNIEIERKIEIPFLSIFIENLEENEEEEYFVNTVIEKVNPLNYILPMLIATFFVTAVGKTIYNNKIENQKKQQQFIEKQNKNKKVINKVKVETTKPENVPQQTPVPVIKEKVEEIAILPQQNNKEKEIERPRQKYHSKKVKVSKIEKDEKVPVNLVKKQQKIEKRFSNVKSKPKHKIQKNFNNSLDEEIKRNWKKLGRDENGNII